MNNTRIVELVIDEDSQELAIDAISLVSAPAIEENWVFFGKEKNNLTLAKVDEEKRMLVSPALIPNKQIFRYDPNTDSDYYVYFSPETVRQASELYLRNNNHHKATEEHTERVSGVLTVESWIKEGDSDKSKMYGFDLPNGTWFVKMKIENDDLWKKIKDGSLKGLSIEGYFTNKFEQMQKKEPTTEQILSALNEMIQSKTELKTEKIELGAIDDLEKGIKKAITFSTKAHDIMEKAAKSADAQADKFIKESRAMQKLKSDIEKQAKELGVELPKNIKSVMNDLDANFESIIKLRKSILNLK